MALSPAELELVQPRPPAPGKIMYHLHISKTGGTTFERQLKMAARLDREAAGAAAGLVLALGPHLLARGGCMWGWV